MKSDHNKYRRELYNDRKKWGICPVCGGPIGDSDTTCCKACLEKRRTWANDHKVQLNESRRNIRIQRKAAGLCEKCNSPVDGEHNLCAYHINMAREYSRRGREKRRESQATAE